MEIQWYPGHMTKTVRAMQEDIRLVDMLIELRDARIPISSKNPQIDDIAGGKPRVILLNKRDLADEAQTEKWIARFESGDVRVMAIDARERREIRETKALIDEAGQKKRERDRARGILNRPFRIMVVGIPNIGKSTFINSFAQRASAKTGDKPGVTRGKQWIKIGKTAELLDTPGILWPKFDDRAVGVRLALTGAIRDEILPTEELAAELIGILREKYPDALRERYGTDFDGGDGADFADSVAIGGTSDGEYGALAAIAEARHLIQTGGEPDIKRAAAMLLDDFRAGRLGRISLEHPGDK